MITVVIAIVGMFVLIAILGVGSSWMVVNAVAWRFGLEDPKKIMRPAPLNQFFSDYACPDCGADVVTCEDGGHDVLVECVKCAAKFGIQLPPFNLIERVGYGKPAE